MSQPELTESNLSNLILARNLHKEYPDLFNEAQIRWILNNRQDNGLHKYHAVLKVSNRLYIKKDAFFDWFSNQSSS